MLFSTKTNKLSIPFRFNPHNNTIAIAKYNIIEIWDISDRKLIKTLKGHEGRINSIQYCPTKDILVSTANDKSVIIWCLAYGSILRKIKDYKAMVHFTSFSQDGKSIISSADDKTFRVLDILAKDNYEEDGFEATYHKEITAISYNPSGQLIGIGSVDNKIRIFDAKGNYRFFLEGHNKPVRKISFSPVQNEIASCSDDGTIKIWSITEKKNRLTIESYSKCVNSISYSPDGHYLLSCFDNIVCIYDVHTGKTISLLELDTLPKCASFNNNGSIVVAGDSDGNLYKLLFETQKLSCELLKKCKAHEDTINSISFCSDGRTFASASNDQTIKIWDLVSMTPLNILYGHKSYVNSVSYSPDGRKLVSCSGRNYSDIDNTIKIWDVENGVVIETLTGHEYCVNDVSFSPDGEHLVSASVDGLAKIWKIPNLQSLINKVRRQFSNYRPTPEERKKYYLD